MRLFRAVQADPEALQQVHLPVQWHALGPLLFLTYWHLSCVPVAPRGLSSQRLDVSNTAGLELSHQEENYRRYAVLSAVENVRAQADAVEASPSAIGRSALIRINHASFVMNNPGFVSAVYWAVGKEVLSEERSQVVARMGSEGTNASLQVEHEVYAQWLAAKRSGRLQKSPMPGDQVFFGRAPGDRRPALVGIVLGSRPTNNGGPPTPTSMIRVVGVIGQQIVEWSSPTWIGASDEGSLIETDAGQFAAGALYLGAATLAK